MKSHSIDSVESRGRWKWKRTLTLSLKERNNGSSDINVKRGVGERSHC